MSKTVIFEIDAEDLQKMQMAFASSLDEDKKFDKDEVIKALHGLMGDVRDDPGVPKFILERLEKLNVMVDIIADSEWQLRQSDADNVLNTLAYFADPQDLIPDKVPGIGYIDDAIMVEIALQRLEPEIESYSDFCDFRRAEEQRQSKKGVDTSISREDWLKAKRSELQSEMRKKRSWFRPFS